MKKFLAGIAAAAIITVPMTSFALESMSKGALKKATGQAGVSIALDNVVIVQKTMPSTTYWDVDGTSSIEGTLGQVAQAGLKISYADAADAQKMIVLDGILTGTGNGYGIADIDTTFGVTAKAALTGITAVGIVTAGSGVSAGNPTGTIDPSNGNDIAAEHADNAYVSTGVYRTGISPLTIDVGTCQALTAGLNYNLGTVAMDDAHRLDVAGVVIGLPTLEITTYHSEDVKVISIVTDPTSGAHTANGLTGAAPTVANVSNEMIRIEKTGVSQMAILGGRLEIAPH